MTIRIHAYTFSDISFCQPTPCPPFASFNPPYTARPPVYLLGDPSSFACGANTHPLLSLVGYQLFSPCCLTHPKGTPQIKLCIYIDDINNISRPVWFSKKGQSCNLFLTGLRRLDLCAAEANIQAEWGGVHPDWWLCCGVQPELQVTLSMRCSYHFMKYSLNFRSLYHWSHDDIMRVIEYIE